MADKLIPGIPHVTRVAILQQTGVEDESGGYGSLRLDKTILDAVLSSDETRNETVRTAECENTYTSIRIETLVTDEELVLSKSFDTEDPLEPVKAIRKIQYQQAELNLFLAHKNADLKSGARGFQARKDLKTAEANMESVSERYGIEKIHEIHDLQLPKLISISTDSLKTPRTLMQTPFRWIHKPRQRHYRPCNRRSKM